MKEKDLVEGRYYAATWTNSIGNRKWLVFIMPKALSNKTYFINRRNEFRYSDCLNKTLYQNLELRDATLEEIVELTQAIIKHRPDFKIGDWVYATVPDDYEGGHWLKNDPMYKDVRVYQITSLNQDYSSGKLHSVGIGDGKAIGGIDPKWMRPATEKEIADSIPKLPVINKYEGSIDLDKNLIVYGCAKLSIDWFRSTNSRHISYMVLDSEVMITKDNMDIIRNVLIYQGIIK